MGNKIESRGNVTITVEEYDRTKEYIESLKAELKVYAVGFRNNVTLVSHVEKDWHTGREMWRETFINTISEQGKQYERSVEKQAKINAERKVRNMSVKEFRKFRK